VGFEAQQLAELVWHLPLAPVPPPGAPEPPAPSVALPPPPPPPPGPPKYPALLALIVAPAATTTFAAWMDRQPVSPTSQSATSSLPFQRVTCRTPLTMTFRPGWSINPDAVPVITTGSVAKKHDVQVPRCWAGLITTTS
jgi:hypothetical protein